MWKKSAILVIGSLLFLAADAEPASAPRLIYRSQKKRPKWIVKPPKDKKNLYFVGTRTGAESLNQAKREAVDNAVKEIVEYFGIKAETRYQAKASYYSTQIMDQIETKGEARVAGISLEEMYYEEWIEEGARTYNVFVLLQYPRAELEKEKKRLKEEEARKKREAIAIAEEGDKEREAGDLADALSYYGKAIKLLEGVESGGGIGEKIQEKAGALLRRLGLEALEYDKEGETSKGLKRPLRVKAFYQGKRGRMPLKHFPVEFEFKKGSGLLDKKVYTNKAGVAESSVRRINRPQAVNIVEARLSQEVISDFAPAKVVFQFRSKGEPIPLFVKAYFLNFGQGLSLIHI